MGGVRAARDAGRPAEPRPLDARRGVEVGSAHVALGARVARERQPAVLGGQEQHAEQRLAIEVVALARGALPLPRGEPFRHARLANPRDQLLRPSCVRK